ncbi:MAG: lytic transglycosylase [Betaproteobacteria bacterium CG2_30_68_42]|nr:MAG: lytic transglycosylase [Betaproteobacteria bacterium CG2_30_68_42]
MRQTERMLRALAIAAALCALDAGASEAAPEGGQWSTQLVRQALALEHGEGVARDPRRAADLYCEAAKLGSADAQFELGWMYANGRGVPRDDALAALFFEAAAYQGHEYAQRMLRHVGAPTSELPECLKIRIELAAEPEPEPEEEDTWEKLYEDLPPERRRLVDLVRKLAPDYSVDPRLALAVISVESNFEPRARSPKNAQGLMQLIPETAIRFNVRNAFDPVQNIRGGLAYLRWLLAYFKGSVALTAAGYNAGERAVERFRGIPPYQETRAYVTRILAVFRKDNHPYDASVTAPSPFVDRMRLR